VETLMRETGIGRELTVMVGDSSVDINTAINARVRSCGVTYGFQPETLLDPKPDLLVDRMEQLVDWVLGKAPNARNDIQTDVGQANKPAAD
jgi:phosphoglycolate phosphatase